MMKKAKLPYYIFAWLFVAFGCTEESTTPDITRGDTPVSLSGVMTRADGTPRNDIYVKAFLPGPAYVYFNETLTSIPQGLSTSQSNEIKFPGAVPYYPLDNGLIHFFAYSGKATPGDKMYLTAGTGSANDAVLSNYGKRKNDADFDASYEGSGTPGSSANPAETLLFRHVMTQLTVDVKVADETPEPSVDPVPQTINFKMEAGVPATGRYAIRATETDTDVSTDRGGNYTIKKGVNYLIPTGVDLTTTNLTSLVIDNYTATKDDLSGFKIKPSANNQSQDEMKLMPGYSYNLTFTVKRLKVQSITLKKVAWTPHEVSSVLDSDKYPVILDFNQYDGDQVNRVVLNSSTGTYVGQLNANNVMEFITLPDMSVSSTETINSVALYTERGLLIETNKFIYTPTSPAVLAIPLSEGGLQCQDPNVDYNKDTNPYIITTPQQFMNVSKDLTARYVQMSTIDLRTLNLVDDSRIFNGFGAFTGIYEGNGYRIDGIDIQAPGLFASNSGTLSGIRLTTGTIDASGLTNAGSICGVNTGTIAGCINEARVIATPGNTEILGGICGTNSGQIIGCLNTGSILNGTTVGGICGYNQNINAGAIIACINTGMMNPKATDLGYIIGKSEDATAVNVIQTCYGLVGTAQEIIGGPEKPVGTGIVLFPNTASLEPDAIRGKAPETPIESWLESAMNSTMWGSKFQFEFDHAITSVTWPAPVIVTNP